MKRCARQQRRLRVLQFLIVAGAACLQPALAADVAGGYPQGLIDVPLALVLNGEPRGDIFAKLADDGDVLIESGALVALGAQLVGGSRYLVDSETYVSLRSVPGARFELDERNLQLSLTLPPDSFGLQLRSFTAQGRPEAIRTENDSVFLNYRLGYLATEGAGGVTTLSTEAGVRLGAALLRSDSVYVDNSDARFVRFQTQLVYDARDRAQRWLAGDTFATSGELGSTLNLGGLAFAKVYQMTPYFVRYPTATFAGAAALPSEVEVFVGETRVYRDRLAPGPFELRDFNYYAGRQDVRMVIRDAVGQEQVFTYPYYFTDLLLGAGLHEYGYHAGWLRENYGLASNDYGPFAASAFHRYGITDFVTVGVRGEYADERGNAGPALSVRADGLGTLLLAAAAGWDGRRDTTGGAGAAAYQYRYGPLSLRAGHRELAAGYAVADPLANERLLRYETLAGAGYGSRVWGNLDLQYVQSRFRDEPESRAGILNYSRALWGQASLSATVRRTFSTPVDTDVFAGVSATFGRQRTVSAFHISSGDVDTDVVQAANTLGPREGLGYRVSAERSRQGAAETVRLAPSAEYNAPHATFIAESRTSWTEGASTESWQVAVQGALSAVEDSIVLSRRIEDSFALARVTPPLEDVRVYHNNQEIGRTGKDGAVVIPNLGSFLDNVIAIDEKDVPIEYGLSAVSMVISPPFRSGSLVEFRTRRIAGLGGRLEARRGRRPVPLEYHQATIRVDGKDVDFLVGADGEFYLEDLAPGRYRGSVDVSGRPCRFELDVPYSDAPLAELTEPVTCELAR